MKKHKYYIIEFVNGGEELIEFMDKHFGVKSYKELTKKDFDEKRDKR